jgi:hypothetical protein
MPVVYVDEAPPARGEPVEANPLPSVEAAMAAANARQSQILNYTQSPPLKQPEDDLTTSNGQSELDRLRAEIQALKGSPHSVNETPEVSK